MTTVKIIRIIESASFKGYKRMHARLLPEIGHGEAVIVFNKARDKARLFDSAGGIYMMPYAPRGESFNVQLVMEMIESGLYVELSRLAPAKQKRA